jgi:plastocyanin
MRTILRGPAVIGVSLLLAACGGGGVTQAPGTAAGATQPAATAGATTAAEGPCTDSTDATDVSAAAEGNAWVPPTVTAKVGDVITWANADSVPHAVGLDDGSCAMTGTIAGGQSKSLVFSEAGSFPFHCTIHPSMKGTITIT